MIEKEECVHIEATLKAAISALSGKDAAMLRELSNQTVHMACSHQDESSVSIGVLIYALSKIVEREDYKKIKNWNVIEKKINSFFSLAVRAMQERNFEVYEKYIKEARRALASSSINLRPYVEEVLKKASINKASKIYEHGLSLEQTSKLLGVSQWELAEYVGQKTASEITSTKMNIKRRVKMAMEFFG